MDLKWMRRLEAFEMTGEIGLRYMLILLIVLGLLVSANVIMTGQQFSWGFLGGILDSVLSLVVMVALVVIAREFWFFRSDLQAIASKHHETHSKAKDYLEKYG